MSGTIILFSPLTSQADIMKQILSPLFLLGISSFVWAESPATVEQAREALQDAAIDQETDFAEAYEAAEAAGVGESDLLESKVLHLLGRGDLEAVMALVPAMEEHAENFRVGEDGFFTDLTQVLGLIENLKALIARQNQDWEAFERHAKEGFWKAPNLSQAFGMAELISETRADQALKKAMAELKIPMEMAIASVDGSTTTLAELSEGQKAILVDFWASWCGPCIALMPELKHKAEVLPSQSVPVAGMNTDRTDPLEKARKVQEEHGMDMPWLIEPETSPFSRVLMVDSIPRMVLISPDGGVLFNGHPMDPELVATLKSIGVTL